MSTTVLATPVTPRDTLRAALDEVSAASAAGAPFLLAFALTLLACGLLGFVLPVRTAAWCVLLQGNLALPLAFLLERRLGRGRMAATNPLRALSVQMAMSQVVALPAAFIAYAYHPALVPAAMAAIGGGHFLPYAWLQRTRVYAVLGPVVSVGAFALTIVLRRGALPWVCLFMAACYLAAAPLLLRHARRLAGAADGA